MLRRMHNSSDRGRQKLQTGFHFSCDFPFSMHLIKYLVGLEIKNLQFSVERSINRRYSRFLWRPQKKAWTEKNRLGMRCNCSRRKCTVRVQKTPISEWVLGNWRNLAELFLARNEKCNCNYKVQLVCVERPSSPVCGAQYFHNSLDVHTSQEENAPRAAFNSI